MCGLAQEVRHGDDERDVVLVDRHATLFVCERPLEFALEGRVFDLSGERTVVLDQIFEIEGSLGLGRCVG